MSRVERQRERYYELKSSNRCGHCGAGLPEDHERVLCVECTELDDLRKSIHARTPEGAKKRAELSAKHRADRIARGCCVYCPNPPRPGRTTCADCAEARTAAQAKYRERKRQGIIPIGPERAKRREAERLELLERYRELRGRIPIPKEVGEPRLRILRALVHLEWIRSADLWIVLGIEELDGAELGRWIQTLSREVKAGTIDARGPRGSREYNLSDAGRAFARELAEVA